MNNAVNAATEKSPYEMLFGYRPKGLENAFLQNATAMANEKLSLQEIRGEAEKRIKKSKPNKSKDVTKIEINLGSIRWESTFL